MTHTQRMIIASVNDCYSSTHLSLLGLGFVMKFFLRLYSRYLFQLFKGTKKVLNNDKSDLE